jgi:hypothetical protein
MVVVLITVAIFATTIIFMPKRITWLEIYTTSWFAIAFCSLVDIYLDLKLHLYGFFNREKVDWEVLILYFGMYPLYNAIFLNFFPASSLWRKILYFLANEVVLVSYEWLMIQTGVIFYAKWTLWYSALAYPFILLILCWNWKITKQLFNKAKLN